MTRVVTRSLVNLMQNPVNVWEIAIPRKVYADNPYQEDRLALKR